MKKKIIAISVSVVLLIGIALAIILPMVLGQKERNQNVDWNFMNLPKDYEAELTLGIMDSDGDEEIATSLIASFNKIYKNIRVTPVRISGSYAQSVQGMISADNMPDVFWLKDEHIRLFAYKGITQNIQEAWDLYEGELVDKTDVVTSMLDIGRFNGNLHMLPRDYNKVTVAYNRDLFKKYGIAEPTDDNWTWQKFLDTCEAFKKKMSVGEYPVDANLYWLPVYNAIVNGFGGSLIEDGEVTFDSANSQKGLEEIRKLVQKGYAVNPAQVTLDTFSAGKTAMYFMSRPYVIDVIGSSLNADYAAFPELPTKAVVGTGCTGYSIYSGSKNKDAAFLFLMSILSKDSQEAFGETGASVPVLRSLFDTGVWTETPSTDIHHAAFIAHEDRDLVADHMDGLNPELSVDIEGIFLTLIKQSMSNPEKTIADICAEQKTKLVNTIKNF